MAHEVGLPITVGIARTKFLAKVASGVAKPDGLLLVPPDRERAFLHPLPVERLWGVGKVTSAKLHALGVRTVADAEALGEAGLVSVVGRAAGSATSTRWRAGSTRARSTPPGAAAPSARNRRSAAAPAAIAELDAILAGTLDRLGRRLREGHRTARTVVLRLRFDDFSRATRSHSLAEATAHTATLLEAARVLLRGALPMIHERGITLLGISLSGLDERPQRPARPPVRRAERARHRRRARCGAAAIRQPIGRAGHPVAPASRPGNPPFGRLAMTRSG